MSGTAIVRPTPVRRLPWINAKIVVAATVIALAVGFLIYSGMQSSVASYFVTVGELQQQSATMDGQRVRVGGTVLEGSVQGGGVDEPIRFQITDGTSSIPVIYHDVAPDIFNEHVEVVVEGTYHANGEFQAETLLTKCPSRFESGETT